MTDFKSPFRRPKELTERALRKVQRPVVPEALWYTRCPVPTPLGLAAKLGWFEQEFAPDAVQINTLQDNVDPSLRSSHYDHHLYGSFRQGGNVPALWAKASGADTLLIGLNWLDEAQLILVRDDQTMSRISDLAGKTLALPQTNNLIDHARAGSLKGFYAVLQLSAIQPEQVQWQDIQPEGTAKSVTYAQLATQLLTKQVDAIFVKGAKGVELAQLHGLKLLYDLRQHPDPLVRANNGAPRPITVDAALWRDHPDLVLRFLDRILDVEDWAAEHPQATFDYVAQESGSTTALVRQAYGDDLPAKQGTSLSADLLEALSHYKDFLLQHGFLPANFDIADWVEAEPLKILQRARSRRRAMQPHVLPTTAQTVVAAVW
jgi:ABC-type nitrate/sulfonate/bicarbonate transport system substrate-binding protein